MSQDARSASEILALLGAACEDGVQNEELRRLESLIGDDESSLRLLSDYFRLHAELALRFRGEAALCESLRSLEAATGMAVLDDMSATVNPLDAPSAINDLSGGPAEASPSVRFPGFAPFDDHVPATLGCFSSGWPLAYLVATVILGVGLVIGSVMHISPPEQVAVQLPSSSTIHYPPSTSHSAVGRITGMADCEIVASGQWPAASEDKLPSPVYGRGAGGEGGLHLQSAVHLHDRFVLRSGLLEITYDTGARVILQGPVTYDVDSAAGGYLSIGRLTARLGEREEGRGERIAINHQSTVNNRQYPSPLFTITTPTAVVTDLGTEFGVEVRRDHREDVVVLQGRVRVAINNGQDGSGQTRTLKAGQLARIAGRAAGTDSRAVSLSVDTMSAESAKRFVRVLPSHGRSSTEIVAGNNLVLWLKADAITGCNDGDSVSTWRDSSDRHNHMYRLSETSPRFVSGAHSGLHGMPAVRFAGHEQLCGVLDTDPRTPGIQPLSEPFVLLSVVRNTGDNKDAPIRGYLGGGRTRLAFGLNCFPSGEANLPPNSFWTWAPYLRCSVGQTNSLNTNWNIHAYTFADMTQPHWTWRCNGMPVASVGMTDDTPRSYGDEAVYIGSTGNDEFWVGDIVEVLLYNRMLTELELHQVERYLAKKYAIETTRALPRAAENAQR